MGTWNNFFNFSKFTLVAKNKIKNLWNFCNKYRQLPWQVLWTMNLYNIMRPFYHLKKKNLLFAKRGEK
jgi:hypothetical protein